MTLRHTPYLNHPKRKACSLRSRSRNACPATRFCKPLQVLTTALCLLSFSSQTAITQEVFCVPPALPVLPSDPEMQIEYRSELSQEYNDYFRLAAEYLNCLNASGSATREGIQQAITDYNNLLNLPAKPRQGVADGSESYLLQ